MKNIIEQWNTLTTSCEPVTRFAPLHTIRSTCINTNGVKCGGINIAFEGDVSIKYYAYLVPTDNNGLAIEYAYYTADTGIKYLDKKRVEITYGSAGIDTLDVDTLPLERSLSKLKKYEPHVPMSEALDVLRRQLRSMLSRIEISEEDLLVVKEL